MISMELNEDQNKQVSNWAAEGCNLSEIQKRINHEFNLSLTFMDVRFLILDQGIEMKDKQTVSAFDPLDLSKTPLADNSPQTTSPDELQPLADNHVAGNVSVDIDRLQKPGAVVSGTVNFSDGVSASWSVDQAGRLTINAGQPDYRPSQTDIQAFQKELSKLLQSRGL